MAETRNIYVCNPMGDMLYLLEDIDKSSVSLHELLNGQWELSFTYTKAKNENSPAFDALEEGMYLYLDGKAHFKMRQPTIRIDAATESKDIHAYSCEVELEDKNITFSIDTGEKTSLEYLLNDGKLGLPYVWHEDPDDTTSTSHEAVELLCDPYTTRLYDWIVLHNTYVDQLKQFLSWYRAQTLAEDGSLTIMQETNEWAFNYCKFILTQITRLRSRAEDINPDHDGNGIEDVVTVEDLLDVSTVDYRFIQYVTEVRPDEYGEVTGYVLGPAVDKEGQPITGESFESRILMLIGFYQEYGKQLSLLDIMCAQTNYTWVVGDIYGLNADSVTFSSSNANVTEAIYNAIVAKYEVANSRMPFEIDESIYSFLTSTYARRTNRLVTFDRLARRINITPVEFVGEDTGIAFDYDQLLNTLNISTNEDTLATRITVHGADGLSIEQVNFGEDYVVDIDYKLNARGRDGKRLYVSDALAEKYARYQEYREERRANYFNLTSQRNQINADIYELKYRLPADSMQTDWDSYADDELVGSLKEYSNKLNALQQLYGADYGFASELGTDPWVNLNHDTGYTKPEWRLIGNGETLIPRTEKIQQTMYWWDYVAYCQTITQINIAMQARHISDVSYRFSQITADSPNVDVQEMHRRITAWETEWSLYGTVELTNKIAAYDNQLQVMIENNSVEVRHCAWSDLATKPYTTVTPVAGSNPHALGLLEEVENLPGSYRITDDVETDGTKEYYSSLQTCFVQQTGMTSDAMYNAACEVIEKKKYWNELLEDDKKYFVDQAAYVAIQEANIISQEAIPWDATATESGLTDEQKQAHGNNAAGYFYDEYVEIYNNKKSAQTYLDTVLMPQLTTKEEDLADVQSERDAVATNARLETYEHPTLHESFTNYELKVLNLLMRDSDYTNEYILTTDLNDTVTALDHMEELYQDAIEKVRLFSRPQLIFSVGADNLLALPEFVAWHNQFELGNYIYVEYRDGEHTRVRMVGLTYNPCMVGGDMSIEFSNLTYSKTEVSDVESVLGMAQTTTSSGGGGSGGGSGSSATFEDLLARISQSMLERLLSPEGFVKEVSNVVASKVVKNKLTSKEQIWRSLANGLAEIDGGCLKTGTIISSGTVTHRDDNGDLIVDENDTPIEYPVSWLSLDSGEFNFGDGALMFYFGRDANGNIATDVNGDPVAFLFLKGQIDADAGNIGGCQIGDPYLDPNTFDHLDSYNNKLFIGESGFRYYCINPTTYKTLASFRVGIDDLVTPASGGSLDFSVYKYNTSNPSQLDATIKTQMSAGFLSIYKTEGNARTHAMWYDTTNAQLFLHDNFVCEGNISSVNESTANPSAYAKLLSNGNIEATGAISGASVSAGNMINNGSYAGADNLRVYGSSKWIAVTPASDTNVNPNSSNSGVSLHSNGRIRAYGDVYSGTTKLTGGDYAEYFEWQDTNPQCEDRRGRFVTLDKDKIKLATASDDYILGIITGTPSVLGNGAWNEWHDKHLRDDFGAIITEPVEYPAVLDDDGNVVEEAHVEYEPVINPDYDPTREYIPREQRSEWAPVGLVGQIIMLDDGTCEVNGFATSADEGIATKADGITNYRVIKRIDSNHIMVAAK